MKNLNLSLKNKMSRTIFFVFALLMCMSVPSFAEQLTCTVTVIDTNSNPISDAEVFAYERTYNDTTREKNAKHLSEPTKTDASGTVTLTLDFTSQMHVMIVARKGGFAIGWDSLPYTNKAHPNIKIILDKPAEFAGKVVDKDEHGIAVATVRAIPKNSSLDRLEQNPIYAPENWFTTTTDVDGCFSLENFSLDVYTDLWVDAPGWEAVYKYTTYYLSSCGFEVGRKDIQLVLPNEIEIKGRVIDAVSDKAIEGIAVLIRPNTIEENINVYYPLQTVSGPDGAFSFKGVPPIQHYIEAFTPEGQTPQYADKTISVDTTGCDRLEDIVLKVDKGSFVEAVVLNSVTNTPIPGASVNVSQAPATEEQGWFTETRVTGTDGKACIRAPLGECNIRMWKDGFQYNQVFGPIEIIPDETLNKEFRLEPEPSITGTVFDQAGQPVHNAMAQVHPFGETVSTDSNGYFQATYDSQRPAKLLLVRNLKNNAAAITEISDPLEPVNVTLKPGLTIVGQVQDSEGKPIPATRISLCIDVSNCLSGIAEEWITDNEGRFEIRATPDSDRIVKYLISATALGYGPLKYKKVEIKEQSTGKVELETLVLMPADKTISGVVIDAEGKPAEGLPIFANGSNQPSRTTASGRDGLFEITRICQGDIHLQAGIGGDDFKPGHIMASGGDTNVKIVMGQESFHLPQISLSGKTLPKLNDLTLDIDNEKIKQKPLLICFFDMNQRPSRHCIKELAKQYEEFTEKGIIVISVQASEIDKQKLDDWLQENKIPFPVGKITGDIEKTRFSWGVKSLPWLILTDKEHIVQDEGFPLIELEKLITDTE